MALKRYLAMTAAEIRATDRFPEGLAWMACHFSPYSTGLSNCPNTLPPGSMLILNDRVNIHDHDPQTVASQLCALAEDLEADSVLLDFQRPGSAQTALVARAVAESMKCPVGVSEIYAGELPCAVFLPPVPLHVHVQTYLQPWQGREVWLEMALDGETVTVTKDGSLFSPGADLGEVRMEEEALFCHYSISVSETAAVFSLQRTEEDLDKLLQSAEWLKVTKAVGLYQELGQRT